jgi:hypothetical protein
MSQPVNLSRNALRAGMVGTGMIFDETYRPLFERFHAGGLFRRNFGFVDGTVSTAVARLRGGLCEFCR